MLVHQGVYPTYVQIITHLLHGMQPSPRRSEEAWHVRVVRTVNMVYGDSSTMDVKYPGGLEGVNWALDICLDIYDIPKKFWNGQPVGATNFYFSKHGRRVRAHSTSGKHPMKVFDLRWDRCVAGGSTSRIGVENRIWVCKLGSFACAHSEMDMKPKWWNIGILIGWSKQGGCLNHPQPLASSIAIYHSGSFWYCRLLLHLWDKPAVHSYELLGLEWKNGEDRGRWAPRNISCFTPKLEDFGTYLQKLYYPLVN